jgi:hypothetical protein
MTATPALEAELSSRAKEASKRRFYSGKLVFKDLHAKEHVSSLSLSLCLSLSLFL